MRIHAAALAALTAFTVLAASQTAGGTLASGPAVTVTPSVSGTIAAGRRLTALTGTWTGSGLRDASSGHWSTRVRDAKRRPRSRAQARRKRLGGPTRPGPFD